MDDAAAEWPALAGSTPCAERALAGVWRERALDALIEREFEKIEAA